MKRLSQDTHALILSYLGFSGGFGGPPSQEEAWRAAVAADCPVTSIERLRAPWLPREPFEGHWLAPTPGLRVVSFHRHGDECIHLKANGTLWGRGRLCGQVTKVVASALFVVALRSDKSALIWTCGVAEELPGEALDVVAGPRSFLVRRECGATLYEQGSEGERFASFDMQESVVSAIACRRADAEPTYVLEAAGGLFELSPPRVASGRRLWSTPLGGCGAHFFVRSVGRWTLARRSSQGCGLRELSAGYAHLGAPTGVVLSFPTLLSTPPRALSSDLEAGSVDVVCSTVNAVSAHFHLLLVLFKGDATCVLWTWCMQWQWLCQTRLTLASPQATLASTRYVALHTGAQEWTIFDAAQPHHDGRFSTVRSATRVAFFRREPRPDEYALLVQSEGALSVEACPNAEEATERFAQESLLGLVGPCARLVSTGDTGAACITASGAVRVQLGRWRSFAYSGVADVVFCGDSSKCLLKRVLKKNEEDDDEVSPSVGGLAARLSP